MLHWHNRLFDNTKIPAVQRLEFCRSHEQCRGHLASIANSGGSWDAGVHARLLTTPQSRSS
jgi:hypothetical protein